MDNKPNNEEGDLQSLEGLFDNIEDEYLKILSKNKKSARRLNAALEALLETEKDFMPRGDQIFAAFKLCPFEKLQVIILGQDPYPDVLKACGLSFSVPRGTAQVPQSLIMIYNCLIAHRLIPEKPRHGCLESWAAQGVLLLNKYLTKEVSNAKSLHTFWESYTNRITALLIKSVYKKYGRKLHIFLWGNKAKEIGGYLERKCRGMYIVHEAVHPSPMVKANKDAANPDSFIHFSGFSALKDVIKWDSICDDTELKNLKVEPQSVFIFTDGSFSGTKKKRTGWGYIIVDGGILLDKDEEPDLDKYIIAKNSGILENGTNNRGELYAIIDSFAKVLVLLKGTRDISAVYLVSDSEYCLNIINSYYEKWIKQNKLDEYKNIDLVKQMMDEYYLITEKVKFKTLHVNSHEDPPKAAKGNKFTSLDYFIWYFNDVADALAKGTY